jgi:hypothetical protein
MWIRVYPLLRSLLLLLSLSPASVIACSTCNQHPKPSTENSGKTTTMDDSAPRYFAKAGDTNKARSFMNNFSNPSERKARETSPSFEQRQPRTIQ